MFVVRYDLTDMPPNSRTFVRQRTLFMPSDANEHHVDSRKWLRYLIHLRLVCFRFSDLNFLIYLLFFFSWIGSKVPNLVVFVCTRTYEYWYFVNMILMWPQ